MNDTIVPTLQRPDVPRLLPVSRATENGHTGVSESRKCEPDTRVVEIVDRSQWNALVVGRPSYDLAQGWEWGDVQRNEGWTPHRYAMLAGAECVAAVSVALRRLPGLPYSILYASRGPLLDWEDERAWRGLLRIVRQLADRHHAIFLRVSPSISHDDVGVRDALARHGFRPLQEDWTTWNAPRVVVTLSLEGDEDALHRRLRKGTRRDLAAAQRRGAQVRVASDRADLLAFHQLTVAAGREKGYPVRRLARLEALWHAYVARGDGVLLLTEHEGAVIGGVLGLRFGRRAYLQRAAISRSVEGQRVHQGPLLYWEFIRWAKAAGCELIDWGGSGTRFPPSETDQGHGVYQFKAGFGSVLEYRVPYHDLVFRPALYQLARATERRALPWAWRLRARLNR
jgi:lipid II:glycine glycyltransferase (peptidoglycan interpeptide bridge formation enzyme)